MLTMNLTITSLLMLPSLNVKSWTYLMATMFSMIVLSMNLTQYFSMSSISSISLMDGMSSTLIMLSMWVTTLMFLASAKVSLTNNNSSMFSYITLILLLTLTLSFSMTNLFTFYIWFEASLIPTALLILIWGYQPERLQASMYLMIYTLTASLPLLMVLSSIYYTSSHLIMWYPWINFPVNLNSLLGVLMLLLAFLVKLPLFSVHLWLPKAHVEAPVAGSMILAAVLLKLGGYGLMRVIILFPGQAMKMAPYLMSLSILGAIMASMICLRQADLKSLIAYSSVGHMGILITGVFSLTSWGFMGAMLMMIAHGIVSSGMFCLANITYEMNHTRSMVLTKGLLMITPSLTLLWFLLISANMAAPPSINLLSEIMLISGVLSKNLLMGAALMALSFTTVAYSLYLYTAISHGGNLILTNPSPLTPSRYYMLMVMHFTPVIALILMPLYVTCYLI